MKEHLLPVLLDSITFCLDWVETISHSTSFFTRHLATSRASSPTIINYHYYLQFMNNKALKEYHSSVTRLLHFLASVLPLGRELFTTITLNPTTTFYLPAILTTSRAYFNNLLVLSSLSYAYKHCKGIIP